MLFSSNVFLFAYLPTVLLLYYAAPRAFRNLILLAVSLVFYGWGEPVYVLLMVGVIALNYAFGLWIAARQKKGKDAKKILALGVAGNLLILGYFKYWGFLLSCFSALFPALKQWSLPEVELPIGISFYIFQSMSYIIDVYRQDAQVQRDPVCFGTYVALFPQLIAGPIVRYRDVAEQLASRRETVDGFSEGIYLFVLGLCKKVLLANPMGSLWNLMRAEEGMLTGWVGLMAYTLQIYFDFSGYSDMARGLGRMFGFSFLENFNYPYISASITEFWRRWHISLSTWFREYVYIPLGGNRRGLRRQIGNILTVWALTGLWHGASWNFVLWGLYYALLLILEKTVLLRLTGSWPVSVRRGLTVLAVMLGWALFYFENLTQLGAFLTRLFVPAPASAEGIALAVSYLPLTAVAMLGATPVFHRFAQSHGDSVWFRPVRLLLCASGLLLCVAALASQSYNPFIYFRF